MISFLEPRRRATPTLLLCLGVFLIPWVGHADRQQPEQGAPPPHTESRKGMVVGTTSPAAIRAGLTALQDGGSAADGAIVTALAQVVSAGGSYVSYGGILSLTYYDAATGKVYHLNACYNTPREEKDPLSIPRRASGRTALVPGFMAGVEATHKRFGKLRFGRLFEPAVAMAENGFEVDGALDYFIRTRKDVLSRLPETKRVFTKEGGAFYAKGDRFRQPELAQTLRQVAGDGAAVMYTGEWARRFVETIRREGGKITLEDMNRYQPIWEEPLQATFRDYQVFAPGQSSLSGVDLIEALNLLELVDLKRRGPCTASPESLFWMIQVLSCQSLSWLPPDEAKHFQGRDFSPPARVKKEGALWVWKQMQAGKWPYSSQLAAEGNEGPKHTDAVVAVDQWGNVAALTHTSNTDLGGETGIYVNGVSVPDSARLQRQQIKQVGPGRRLPCAMTPLVVLRAGKPVLGSSATGGVHQKTVQVLVNILEFGMDPQAAADAPAVMLSARNSTPRPVAQVGEGEFEDKVLDVVRALGQPVHRLSREELAFVRGFWVGVFIDPKTGHRRGGASSVLPSRVEGY